MSLGVFRAAVPKLVLFQSVLFIFLAGCSKGSNAKQLSPDFKVQPAGDIVWVRPTDCRANIKNVICIVGEQKDGEDPRKRACESGAEPYVAVFEELYDNYPPYLQKMFCSLQRIFIEKNFFGTAYAGPLATSGGAIDGALIGIRKSVIDERLTLSKWASWKEQLNLGGDQQKYDLKFEYPKYNVEGSDASTDFVYFVITHEFGHLFDFANGVNDFVQSPDCMAKGDTWDTCPARPGTWSALSWQSVHQARADKEYPLRTKLCFYDCNPSGINANETIDLYQGLNGSVFASSYGSTNAYDDFAEMLALSTVADIRKQKITVSASADVQFDLTARTHEPVLKEKADYLKNLFSRTDLKYP